MKYLFDVCLWNKGDPDHGPVLSLPATPYELLDALEKVRTENGAPVHWKIIGVYSNQFNIPISEEAGSVYELNAFARKLSELNDSQQIACCGLLKMEQEQAGHSLPLSRLIDIACGTHCCQVIPELRSDTQLARYYVERNAVSEIRDLPAEQLSLLNYAAIGEKQRKAEGGVFIRGDSSKTSGYVRRSALIEETHLDLTLRKPEYSILLSVYGRWDPSTGRRRSTLLELPAREEVLNAVLTEYDGMGSSDDVWNRIAWEGLDCAVPMLTDMIFEYGSDTSYVAYHGTMTLDELMREEPAEQKPQGPQMGGPV